MPQQPIRAAAVAGSWYPGTADALRRAVRGYLDAAAPIPGGDVRAVIAPHAGLVYSGPVGAFAYAAIAGRSYDAVAMVGPSHYASFEGVAVFPRGSFDTPFGPVPVAEAEAAALQRASELVRDIPGVHTREHSLEMQLPFLAYVSPGTPIVPLIMGHQKRGTIVELGRALGSVFKGRNVLLVASTDLSHYHDGKTAARLDGQVLDFIKRFDAEGLLDALERFPEHACGGGPVVSVMLAARDLGARDARVVRYADSGDVSGDKSAVVGYVAAALGVFEQGGQAT